VSDCFRAETANKGFLLSAKEIVGQVASEWRAESKAEGEKVGQEAGRKSALQEVLVIQAQAHFKEELPGKSGRTLESLPA
jgi:hypothetical protein